MRLAWSDSALIMSAPTPAASLGAEFRPGTAGSCGGVPPPLLFRSESVLATDLYEWHDRSSEGVRSHMRMLANFTTSRSRGRAHRILPTVLWQATRFRGALSFAYRTGPRRALEKFSRALR